MAPLPMVAKPIDIKAPQIGALSHEDQAFALATSNSLSMKSSTVSGHGRSIHSVSEIVPSLTGDRRDERSRRRTCRRRPISTCAEHAPGVGQPHGLVVLDLGSVMIHYRLVTLEHCIICIVRCGNGLHDQPTKPDDVGCVHDRGIKVIR